MPIDRRTILLVSLAAAGLPSAATAAEPGETIELWPGGPPGMPARPPVERVDERSKDPAVPDRALVGIVRPRMTVLRPAKPNGAAILIMPGGGYSRVVVDKEGYELGSWFAERGFSCFVLFYRLPGDGWTAGPDTCLQDAQRAMRLIRQHAAGYEINPARVCAMGFSAGGHVCADLVARFAEPVYAPVDPADRLSTRPLVAAPIYPVVSMSAPIAHAGSRKNLIGEGAGPALERAHSPQLHIKPDSPPCFLVHAEDDPTVPVENTLLLREAMKARKIAVETHLFTEGGHGFGVRRVIGKPAAVWPELFIAWAKTQGVLG